MELCAVADSGAVLSVIVCTVYLSLSTVENNPVVQYTIKYMYVYYLNPPLGLLEVFPVLLSRLTEDPGVDQVCHQAPAVIKGTPATEYHLTITR
jgi:hypothetical protein